MGLLNYGAKKIVEAVREANALEPIYGLDEILASVPPSMTEKEDRVFQREKEIGRNVKVYDKDKKVMINYAEYYTKASKLATTPKMHASVYIRGNYKEVTVERATALYDFASKAIANAAKGRLDVTLMATSKKKKDFYTKNPPKELTFDMISYPNYSETVNGIRTGDTVDISLTAKLDNTTSNPQDVISWANALYQIHSNFEKNVKDMGS